MFRLRLLGLIASLIPAFSFAQQAPKADLMNFVPVSPNAASLGKFGNVPVNYYTGIPTIDVPLYTIKQNSISLPLKLAYHAGGVKVAELAPWVGAGWALQAGGSIVRNERGLADDLGTIGYVKNDKIIDADNLTVDDLFQAAKGWLDLESDDYLFNFPGGTGKFVLSKSAQAVPIPHQHIKIIPLDHNGNRYTTNSAGTIESWQIITTDGAQYFFEETEETRQIFSLQNNRHITAWNLTKMVSPDKSDTIRLFYQPAGFTTHMPVAQTVKLNRKTIYGVSCGGDYGPSPQPYTVMHNMNYKRLDRIEFKGGHVEFVPSLFTRCDTGDKALDKIVVYDNDNVLVKEISLKFGYLDGTDVIPVEEFDCGTESTERLVLLSVEETGTKPYKFDYIHDKGLPSRFSTAQDHWGFCNSSDDPYQSLLPQQSFVTPEGVIVWSGREANIDYAQQGTLRKITYPTGGITEFEYEGHVVSLASLRNFPEFSAAYNITTNPEREFQVDYGHDNVVIGTFQISYLNIGTGVQFKTENLNESSGNFFRVVDQNDQDWPCTFSAREGNISYFGTPRLPNGTYRIIAMKGNGSGTGVIGQTYLLTLLQYQNISQQGSSHISTVGGLRVKRITDNEPVTSKVSHKEFEYSGGTLNSGLKYGSIQREYSCTNQDPGGGPFLASYAIDEYLHLTSSSNYPLANTQGSPVGYRWVKVKEYYEDDGAHIDNGYTVFEFTTAADYPDEAFESYYVKGYALRDPPVQEVQRGLYGTSSLSGYQFPYAPPRNNDWMRGLLRRKSVWRRGDGGAYDLISREENNYEVGDAGHVIAFATAGLIFDATITIDEISSVRPLNAPPDEVAFSIYSTNGKYIYLASSVADVHDDSGNILRTTTSYHYDNMNHLLPNRVSQVSSDNKKKVTFTSYPHDYLPGTSFIDDLVEHNVINAPIEMVTWSESPQGNVVTGGILNEYLDGGNGLKRGVSTLKVHAGMDVEDFKFSNRDIGVPPTPQSANMAFEPSDQYEERVNFSRYENGRLVEQRKSNDAVQSYIWGYDDTYPIAHVDNCNYNDFAYTSFEDQANGNWSVDGGNREYSSSYTGSAAWNLISGKTIRKTGLSPGDYIVSYWAKSGSLLVNGQQATNSITKFGWTLYSHQLVNIASVTITGAGIIDELRLHPVTSNMTTFAYKPLIGVSHITDPNNRVSYYEYDASGRLIVVRNDDHHIIKKYTYHYAE